MPCSCEGFPPSPRHSDLIPCAEEAIRKIRELEERLQYTVQKNKELEEEIKHLKKAFAIMGNGG